MLNAAGEKVMGWRKLGEVWPHPGRWGWVGPGHPIWSRTKGWTQPKTEHPPAFNTPGIGHRRGNPLGPIQRGSGGAEALHGLIAALDLLRPHWEQREA